MSDVIMKKIHSGQYLLDIIMKPYFSPRHIFKFYLICEIQKKADSNLFFSCSSLWSLHGRLYLDVSPSPRLFRRDHRFIKTQFITYKKLF